MAEIGAEMLLGRAAPERAVLRMTGGDALSVLQDVVTNDVEPLSAPGDEGLRAVYAALLTPQGKYLFDFFVLAGAGVDGVLIDVAAPRAAALAKRLGMYCLRRDARMAGEAEVLVGQVMPADLAATAAEAAPALPAALPEGVLAVVDPRMPALGWRLYAMEASALEAALAGLGGGTLEAATLDARRVALGVPETAVELVVEETFPLEAGLDALAGIDFRKGCYVGQEVTARMRHKTELKKRLVRVAVTGSAPPGTPLTTEAGKPAGTLFTQAGGSALAHVRLDRATGPLTAGDALVVFEP
ncbi:MAG: folate-binding protein [Pseudomonadota bacterium]